MFASVSIAEGIAGRAIASSEFKLIAELEASLKRVRGSLLVTRIQIDFCAPLQQKYLCLRFCSRTLDQAQDCRQEERRNSVLPDNSQKQGLGVPHDDRLRP
jgi:hypothetical protein